MMWIGPIIGVVFLVYVFIKIPKWDLKDKAQLGKLIRLGGAVGLIIYALYLLSKYLR